MENVRFVYAKNNKGQIVTVAYMYNDPQRCIHYAIATLSKRDHHVKKIARDISFGRLVASGGKKITFEAIGGSKYGQIAEFVTKHVNGL